MWFVLVRAQGRPGDLDFATGDLIPGRCKARGWIFNSRGPTLVTNDLCDTGCQSLPFIAPLIFEVRPEIKFWSSCLLTVGP